MTIEIYHNPRCSKSRQTMALLEENNITPKVILYLENVPSHQELQHIIKNLGVASPRGIMRVKEAEYKDNNLNDDSLTEDQLLDAIVKFPKILERPIVVNGDKVAIGRPPENILSII